MKTFAQKPADVTRKWYLVDASEAPLGRLATTVASLLIGKAKPSFTSHVDGGDYVVVVNAQNLVVTGGKEAKKVYYNHSGYPSGLRTRKLGEMDPVEVIEKAVRGMIPANKLRDGRMARLKVYADHQNPHEPQQPEKLSISKKVNK